MWRFSHGLVTGIVWLILGIILPPAIAIFVLNVALWIFLADLLIWKPVRDILTHRVGFLGYLTKEHYNLRAIVLSGILVMVSVLFLADIETRQLSLAMGREPPQNRFVAIKTNAEPLTQSKHATIVQFGVEYKEVGGINVGFNLGTDFDRESVFMWFGARDFYGIPPENQRFRPMIREIINTPPIFRIRAFDGGLTPSTSFFVYFESDDPIEINDQVECFVREAFQITGNDCLRDTVLYRTTQTAK